jgi:predicted amidophosphoribosyltransferase
LTPRREAKRCPLCGWRIGRDWKYCQQCASEVRRAMVRSGYLTPVAGGKRETEGDMRKVSGPIIKG